MTRNSRLYQELSSEVQVQRERERERERKRELLGYRYINIGLTPLLKVGWARVNHASLKTVSLHSSLSSYLHLAFRKVPRYKLLSSLVKDDRSCRIRSGEKGRVPSHLSRELETINTQRKFRPGMAKQRAEEQLLSSQLPTRTWRRHEQYGSLIHCSTLSQAILDAVVSRSSPRSWSKQVYETEICTKYEIILVLLL
jgi:hypothetical protein